ncbi:hypothetical protein DSO57_1034560 [Entomophthora muscae]|uniref:Uncharacterized protein n=2 Tax=Entomophthora muscae TaxID=34485 RepID=A0ACC2UK79_9FUNG|nr:hypothetical protein DSO57_1034560 [Entomophthora muscae]
MQKLDLISDRAPINETGPLFPATIVIPCPVSTSGAMYMSTVCLLALFWIIFRFFSTHGIQDLQSISMGVAPRPDFPSTVDHSPPQEEHSAYSESSEEFPVRPPAPKLVQKPLLRLFIVAALVFSMTLLNAHLILSFSRPYRACRDRFGSIFPSLEDSRTSNGWRYSLAVLSSIYYRDPSIQNTVYTSSMLFDFSRAFLISGVLLFYSDFPGAVFRHLPISMSTSYFREWKNNFTVFGYLYAPFSIVVLLLIRILISPSSELVSVLASQYFLDAEALLLFLLCLASGTLFRLKRHQKELRKQSIFTSSYYREGALSDSAVFSDRQRYLLLSEFHVTEYFAQASFAMAACLLCHSICNAMFFSIFQQLGSKTTQPWTLSLLFWLQYLTMPIMACLTMFVIYPREDANATSRVHMAALKPLLNAINRRPSLDQNPAGHTHGSLLPTSQPPSRGKILGHCSVPRVSSLSTRLHQQTSIESHSSRTMSRDSTESLHPSPQALSLQSNTSHPSHNDFKRSSRQILSDSAYYPEVYTSKTVSKRTSLESLAEPGAKKTPPTIEASLLNITSSASTSNESTNEDTASTSSYATSDSPTLPRGYTPLTSQMKQISSQPVIITEESATSSSLTPDSKVSSENITSTSFDSSSPRMKSYIASFTNVHLTPNSLPVLKSHSSSNEVSSLISSMSSTVALDSPKSREGNSSFPIALNPNMRINIQKPADAFTPTPYLSSSNSSLAQTRRSQTILNPNHSSNLKPDSTEGNLKPNPLARNSHDPTNLKPLPDSMTRTNSGASYKTGEEFFNRRSSTS